MAEQDFININLDDVPDTGFPPWPEGVQSVRVVKVEKKQKEGSSYPYLNVSMQHADGKEDCKGQIFLVLSFHPNALWNLKDFLKKGQMLSRDVRKAAKENGIPDRTLDRAIKEVGVKNDKLGGMGSDGYWVMKLPPKKK